MATLAQLEASVRAGTDQQDTGRTPQSVIYGFVNDELFEVVREIAAFAPAPYSKISTTFTLVSGDTFIDVSSLTDLMQILEVQRQSGDKWLSMRPSEYNPEINSFHTTWEQEGFPGAGCKINIYPIQRAAGTYRIKYVKIPVALASGSDVIPLHPGGEKVLIHRVEARIRVREEEDPSSHMELAMAALATLKKNLEPKQGVIGSRGQYR